MKTLLFATVFALSFTATLPGAVKVDAQATPEIVAVYAKIKAENAVVNRAIATRDFAALRKHWSPALVVNNPANLIVGREQIIDSMNHGGLNYTSLKGTTEYFTVTNGAAIEMSHEDVVMAAGPMAGKHLVRRATEIYQRSGDDWLLIARQATYLGFDGAILAGFVPTTYTAPPPTPEITSTRAQIDAINHAVGRAIGTMDFVTLEKLWSPAMVVNSPGNRVLTREQVFAAMREDKLKYASAKVYPDAFSSRRTWPSRWATKRSCWRVVRWPASRSSADLPMCGKRAATAGCRSRDRLPMSASMAVLSTGTRTPPSTVDSTVFLVSS